MARYSSWRLEVLYSFSLQTSATSDSFQVSNLTSLLSASLAAFSGRHIPFESNPTVE